MPAVLSLLGTVLVGAFGIWFAWYTKEKERREKDGLKVTTNRDDPSGAADADAIERLQNESRKLSTKPQRGNGSVD